MNDDTMALAQKTRTQFMAFMMTGFTPEQAFVLTQLWFQTALEFTALQPEGGNE